MNCGIFIGFTIIFGIGFILMTISAFTLAKKLDKINNRKQ